MAGRNAGGDGVVDGDGNYGGTAREHRRASSRRDPLDPELPPEFLVELEKKRRQLDDSIHKYIAARERDYKNFERELRIQLRLGKTPSSPANGPTTKTSIDTEYNSHANRRNISSSFEPDIKSATPPATDLGITGQGSRTPPNTAGGGGGGSSSLIGASRNAARHSGDPLIGSKGPRQTIRMSSAPDLRASTLQADGEIIQSRVGHANLKPGSPGKQKRPPHVSTTGRTSSSGSSVDGRLTSALKSPSQRPKGKRVSLQVGDEIVAPSTPVPQALTRTSSSSHSRTSVQTPTTGDAAAAMAAAARNEAAHPSALLAKGSSQDTNSLGHDGASQAQPRTRPEPAEHHSGLQTAHDLRSDIEFNFFDLDGDEFAPDSRFDSPSPEPHGSNIEDTDEQGTIAGRIEGQPTLVGIDGSRDREVIYDPEGGIIMPEDTVVRLHTSASQQPIESGFRKPSVIRDPVFPGSSYKELEQDAVSQDVYGSSYSRFSKGSFTSGSLGESYMERNAEEMMKKRAAEKAKSQ